MLGQQQWPAQPSTKSGEWPMYTADLKGSKYSPLDQIGANNFSKLEVAWRFKTDFLGPRAEFNLQATPLMVDGVVYSTAGTRRAVVALDAATGRTLWSRAFGGLPTYRGFSYWENKDRSDRRLLFSADSSLYALDARTGAAIPSFGQTGRVDLRQGLPRARPDASFLHSNTPGRIFENLILMGSGTGEQYDAPPGDLRAFDVVSGALVWTFHTIPHPGEFGYDTWPKDAWTYTGGANAWSGISLDEKRGLVFAATGSAAYDFYGGNRHGDNLFANTILCLRAATGQRVWHFQGVKHDVWDRDFPASPALITISKDGRPRDVIAQIAKNGRTYVLDRETGEPIFPMEEIKTPPSDVPGEKLSPTQVVPTLPPPFTRQKFTEDLITKRTPEAEKAVREEWLKLRKAGEFDPPSLQGTVLFPGMDGGGEWGGVAFDPTSGLLFVNANEMTWRVKLAERKLPNAKPTNGKALYQTYCASCHRADLKGTPPEFPSLAGIGERRSVDEVSAAVRQGGGRMPAYMDMHPAMRRAIVQYVVSGTSLRVDSGKPTPFDVRYSLDGDVRFTDPDGFPAIAPPWGTLTAIDLNKAAIAWQVPLGERPGSGLKSPGSENYGGPVATASGLLFIGATVYDNMFRALDSRTGRVLWETTLPAAGNATPAVYAVDGKQYVVIGAGGGKWGAESGGTYVAFALP
jgi:quinoprotein glucose dehydrogenase